ncbi:acyltransferase [Sulfurihydrogenibium sp.]|uniref:acyltransferase family protein n=1 Tax=Sulfurihydrogenibium sp. TaxID=2053621 RepID=UPI002630B801|nr:acyltransferase [Sulfurihydrogenibium sp.]
MFKVFKFIYKIFKFDGTVFQHSLEYNPHLDGLRGIAILLVILFHFFPFRFSFGFIGVDIFFVLSGYLITSIIITKSNKNTFSFKEFYRNRARRLFPALILVLSFSLIIGYFFLLPEEFMNLGKHIKSSALYYQNFRLIDEVGYWNKEAIYKPLLHIWSLSIEEQFYFIWPLLIFFLYKKNKLNLKTFLLIESLLFSLSIFLFLKYPKIIFQKFGTPFRESVGNKGFFRDGYFPLL